MKRIGGKLENEIVLRWNGYRDVLERIEELWIDCLMGVVEFGKESEF